jgi:flagellar biosynthetic protein FlhB
MAEQTSTADRTEAATPKRRQDAHAEGQVPRSAELNTAVLLLGAATVLTVLTPNLAVALRDMFGSGLFLAGAAGDGRMEGVGSIEMVRDLGWRTLAAVSPIILARGVFSTKPLTPNWERINPIENGKRMLGLQPWVELTRSLLKLTIIGVAVYFSISRAWPEMVALAQQSPFSLLQVSRRYAIRLLLMAGLTYVALAALDYGYQLWQHERRLRMTRQEVKQESKEQEGDPMVKARMRSFGRQLARRRMFQAIPTADVVITNPTHIAVALRYDPEIADAPVVVALGQRKIAERIKEIARQHGVPLVENKPLARALLASAKVGMTIPVELYVAVAEVLAFVYRQRAHRGSWMGSATA